MLLGGKIAAALLYVAAASAASAELELLLLQLPALVLQQNLVEFLPLFCLYLRIAGAMRSCFGQDNDKNTRKYYPEASKTTPLLQQQEQQLTEFELLSYILNSQA